MDTATVIINNKTFVLKFGMKVFRLLGEKLGAPTLMSTQQKVLGVLSGMTDDISYEQLDIINNLVLACIEANPENSETITIDELDDLYMANTKQMLEVITVVMNAFAKSLPKPDESMVEGKSKAPVKKVGKK
ncbi:hypothetical protein D3C85_1116650 [compost metagenome]